MRRKKALGFVYIAALLTLLTACAAPGTSGQPLRRSALLMDTVVTVSLYGGGDEALIEACFDKCREYERIFSRTDPDSELYALNRAGSLEVSEDLLSVIETALHYCEYSDGAFDITMGAVSDLYAFSSEQPRVPEEEALAEALCHVGYEKIRVEGNRVTLTDPETVMDLGAIAKGYIADRLAEFLAQQGQESAVIDLGGNIRCVGSKPEGSDFRIGIQFPFKARSETIGIVAVSGGSVVTSGVYERSFEADGVLYHHILDPNTGRPVQNELAAVSILSPCSVDGDALSTVCFALGLEEGLALINSLEGVSAVFITEDMEVRCSDDFAGFA